MVTGAIASNEIRMVDGTVDAEPPFRFWHGMTSDIDIDLFCLLDFGTDL